MQELSLNARNERRKLTASYLNSIAAAVFTIGTIAPLAALAYSNAGPSLLVLAIGVLICVAGSLILHFYARSLLEVLE